VVVQKSYGDLAVTCRKGESSGTASFVSKPNGGAWGNVIAGGLIGYEQFVNELSKFAD
jgi:hypothetical protein